MPSELSAQGLELHSYPQQFYNILMHWLDFINTRVVMTNLWIEIIIINITKAIK